LKLQEDRNEKAEKAGKEPVILPALANQPDLFPDLAIFYNAFNALSTSRDSGFGMGYIKYSEISKYIDEWQIWNMEERFEWIHWIQTIDRIYVKLQSDKQDQDKKNKSGNNKASRGGK
jgi:hypothetical protein